MLYRNTALSQEASLRDGEVHVWKAPLASEHDSSQLTKLLDQVEREQAVSFAFDVDRNRYVHSHGILRLVLARYAGCEARELRFQRDVKQKPHLRQDGGISDLHFSLSHTDKCALIAVRRSWPVGVDIERLRILQDVRVLGSRWFTRSENQWLANLSGAALQEAFFDLWTHREAVIKALGTDLETGLRGLECNFDRSGNVRLVSWQGDREIVGAWRLERLQLGLDYRAALATLGPLEAIRWFSSGVGVVADGWPAPTRVGRRDLG